MEPVLGMIDLSEESDADTEHKNYFFDPESAYNKFKNKRQKIKPTLRSQVNTIKLSQLSLAKKAEALYALGTKRQRQTIKIVRCMLAGFLLDIYLKKLDNLIY